jgi:hypothetical protein
MFGTMFLLKYDTHLIHRDAIDKALAISGISRLKHKKVRMPNQFVQNVNVFEFFSFSS